MKRAGATALLFLLGACFTDRDRPMPVQQGGDAELSVRLLTPATGATVATGTDIPVQVEARDLNALYLEGVGFVARRLAPGFPVVDSAAVRFAARSDSVHGFTFQVPNSFPTNTQVDIYGIAFGPGGETRLSEPSHVTVVQCTNGVCR